MSANSGPVRCAMFLGLFITPSAFAQDFKVLHELKNPFEEWYSGAVSPDGKTLAMVGHLDPNRRVIKPAPGEPYLLLLIDIEKGVIRDTITIPKKGITNRPVAFHPDGKVLAVAHSGLIAIIDLETKKTIQTFTDNPQPNGKTDAVEIEFTKDGKSLIAARINGHVVRIDFASGKESRLARFSGAPGTFALSPDEKHLTVWGDKQSIRIIDSKTGDDVAIVPRGGAINRGASGVGLFHPDGKLLAAIEQGWGIGYFDAKTGKRLPYSSSDRTEIGSIAFTADGKWLISSHAYFNEPGKLVVKKKELLTVKIWDPNTGKLVRTFSDQRFLSLRLVPGPGNIGVDFRHSKLIRIVQFVERE